MDDILRRMDSHADGQQPRRAVLHPHIEARGRNQEGASGIGAKIANEGLLKVDGIADIEACEREERGSRPTKTSHRDTALDTHKERQQETVAISRLVGFAIAMDIAVDGGKGIGMTDTQTAGDGDVASEGETRHGSELRAARREAVEPRREGGFDGKTGAAAGIGVGTEGWGGTEATTPANQENEYGKNPLHIFCKGTLFFMNKRKNFSLIGKKVVFLQNKQDSRRLGNVL